jgi:hypothetical protein
MRVLLSLTCNFSLSRAAVLRARELGAGWAQPEFLALYGEPEHVYFESTDPLDVDDGIHYLPDTVPRHDPILLQLFDEMGSAMSSYEDYAVATVEVPDDVVYSVHSYTAEWVSEQHRCWSPGVGLTWDGHRTFTKNSVWSVPSES